jgi:hypothetical protein
MNCLPLGHWGGGGEEREIFAVIDIAYNNRLDKKGVRRLKKK